MQLQTKRISYCAMFTALAMIFSYVESLIPVNFGIPGMKLGLANLASVTGIYFLSPVEVLNVVVMRILLTGFLFGNGMSIVYSLAGGLLSLGVMLWVKRHLDFSIVGVSIMGGISHNVGQILVAVFVVQSLKIGYYLPILSISGTITGMLIGIVGTRILKILENDRLDFF